MFLHLSVTLFIGRGEESLSGSVFVQGGLCPGVSIQWGSLSGGLCPGGLCPGGLCSGGLCSRGLCPGGSLSSGVCVQ